MKKTLLILISLLLAASVYAQAVRMPTPIDGTGLGQNQFYSVVFDGEGDSIVAAKLKIQNIGKEPLKELNIEIPGENVRLINIMQEAIRFQKICGAYDPKGNCSYYYNQQVWPPEYYSIEKDTEKLSKSAKVTLNLPVELKEGETGTILLYYKTNSYVEKSLGVFNFDFETIKWIFDTDKIRVAVNVQQDLYLEGVKGKIEYQDNFAVAEKALVSGVQSQDLQQFSNQIEWQQGIVKEASGLDPYESFHAKGRYAESWLNLNKGRIGIGILITLIILGLLYYFVYRKIKKAKGNIVLKAIGTGVISGIVSIALWILVSFLLDWIRQFIYYQYSNLLTLLIVLIVGIISLVLIFGPALYFGFKHGFINGIWCLGACLITLMIMGIVAIIIFSLLQQNPVPIYAMAEGVMIK